MIYVNLPAKYIFYMEILLSLAVSTLTQSKQLPGIQIPKEINS